MSLKSRELSQKARQHLARHDWAQAAKFAGLAVGADATDYEAHKLKALAHDRGGDLGAAFSAYEAALKLRPEATDLLQPLAHLAFRLNQMDLSATFYAMLLKTAPDDISVINGYAVTLRELHRFDEAISLCRSTLSGPTGQTPEAAHLWATLGTLLAAMGDLDTALIFLNQSVDLSDTPAARFHIACALMELGRFDEAIPALSGLRDTFRDPDNIASVTLTHAQALLASGQIETGWKHYIPVREKQGTFNELHHELEISRLKPQDIRDKRVLIAAEQGLGDEVLFSTLLPDIVGRFAPASVRLSVEPRLVPLMQRTYPEFDVIAHHSQTKMGRLSRRYDRTDSLDGFTLLGDFLPELRSSLDDFNSPFRALTPNPDRVAHWRQWLETLGPGPKIGLTWKSLKSDVNRDRFYAPFEDWSLLLKQPGAHIISLQYGDISPERTWAFRSGLKLVVPQGLDAMNALDDLAALCNCLDAVAGPSNATTNISAACGTPTYMYAPFPAWIFLGANRHPFYPSVKLFVSDPPGKATTALPSLIKALAADFA